MRAARRRFARRMAVVTAGFCLLLSSCGGSEESRVDTEPSDSIRAVRPPAAESPEDLPSADGGPGNTPHGDTTSKGIASDTVASAALTYDDITAPDLRAAQSILESYYSAVDAKRYEQAYRLWSDSGRASGQTIDELRAGYAETATVRIDVGDGTLQGAAGSRYAEFPVEIHATAIDGTTQLFTGHYVLRRTVVDGATEEQRAWRIYSAEVRQVE